MNLIQTFEEMQRHERLAKQRRADIVNKLNMLIKKAPRGFQSKMAQDLPKYNKLDGRAHLTKALNGKAIDPEVLQYIDQHIPS